MPECLLRTLSRQTCLLSDLPHSRPPILHAPSLPGRHLSLLLFPQLRHHKERELQFILQGKRSARNGNWFYIKIRLPNFKFTAGPQVICTDRDLAYKIVPSGHAVQRQLAYNRGLVYTLAQFQRGNAAAFEQDLGKYGCNQNLVSHDALERTAIVISHLIFDFERLGSNVQRQRSLLQILRKFPFPIEIAYRNRGVVPKPRTHPAGECFYREAARLGINRILLRSRRLLRTRDEVRMRMRVYDL